MFVSDQYGGRQFLIALINANERIFPVVIDAKNNLIQA